HRFGAAHEQRRGPRAMAGLAGALLLVHLLLGAIDFGARQNLVLTRTALGQLPHHHALDQIRARLQAEDGIGQFEVTRRLVVEIEDFGFHDFQPSLFGASAGTAAFSRFFTDAGIGTSLCGFLTASRTITQPPLEPGTAPRTMIRPRSTSTLATSRFWVVTLSTPSWPCIFLF